MSKYHSLVFVLLSLGQEKRCLYFQCELVILSSNFALYIHRDVKHHIKKIELQVPGEQASILASWAQRCGQGYRGREQDVNRPLRNAHNQFPELWGQEQPKVRTRVGAEKNF